MSDPYRHTWPGGRCPDGHIVKAPQSLTEPLPDPLPPRDLLRARIVGALVVVVALVAVVIGVLR